MRHAHLQDSGLVPHTTLDFYTQSCQVDPSSNGTLTLDGFRQTSATGMTNLFFIRVYKRPGLRWLFIRLGYYVDAGTGTIDVDAGSATGAWVFTDTSPAARWVRVDMDALADDSVATVTIQAKNSSGANYTRVRVSAAFLSPRSDTPAYTTAVVYA